jgi:hypothetical protein
MSFQCFILYGGFKICIIVVMAIPRCAWSAERDHCRYQFLQGKLSGKLLGKLQLIIIRYDMQAHSVGVILLLADAYVLIDSCYT